MAGSTSVALYSDGEIDLRVVFSRLYARWKWIAASVVLVAAAFTVAAFLMTPVYRASVVVVDASADRGGGGGVGALGQLGGLAALAGITVGAGGQVEESLAVLRSREFTENFIRKHDLMPILFHKRWDAHAQRWKGEPERWPTLAQAFQLFDGRVRDITHDKLSGLITLSVEWTDPELAARWANGLIEQLNAEMRARAIASAADSVGYLEKELSSTSVVETRQSIGRLLEAQINRKMLATVTQEYAFRIVDRALPPEVDDEVRPNKPLLLAVGIVVGLLLGIVLALGAAAFGGQNARENSPLSA